MQSSLSYPIVNLDTIITSVLCRLVKKQAKKKQAKKKQFKMKTGQYRDVLQELLLRFFWTNRFDIYRGNPWNAWTQASHTTLAVKLDLSREWVCTLIKRLREIGWITTSAPRKPDGKQESTTFRPGPMLRQFLKTLLESKRREKNRANSNPQVFPSSSLLEPEQTDRQTDCPIPTGFMDGLAQGVADKRDMNKAKRW